MTTHTTVAEVAERLADTAHELAHLTRPEHRADTLPHPADVYGLLAELRLAAGHLDEVCKHLAMASLDFADDDRLHHDRHGHDTGARGNAQIAAAVLQTAHKGAAAVYSFLNQAQTAYSPLSLKEVTE